MNSRKPRSVRRSEKRRRIMPPLRGGVNAAPIRLPLDPSGTWRTLGEWLSDRFGSEAAAGLLERGSVLAGHGITASNNYPYRAGERIWIFRPVPDEPAVPIELAVVAENERFVVVDKPHGMASVPKGSHVANSVLVAARRQFKNDLLVAAHRLDLETAGLVLLVKEPQWRGAYQLLFERRRIRKTYRAVAPLIGAAGAAAAGAAAAGAAATGAGTASEGALGLAASGQRWHSELMLQKTDGELRVQLVDVAAPRQNRKYNPAVYYGERRRAPKRIGTAITDIALQRVVGTPGGEQLGVYALYPHTGFTHQLRVAMAELGAPICGDPLYPHQLSLAQSEAREYPLQLLAASLDFVDPITGEAMRVESRQHLALEIS